MMPEPRTTSGTLTLILPGLPPSANNRTRPNGRGGQILTPEAEKWMQDMAWIVRTTAARSEWHLAPKSLFLFSVLLTHPHPLTFDVDNRAKALLDCVTRTLGLDDRYIQQLVITKQIGPEVQTQVWLTPL